MELHGKIALVTGAGQGIGKAIARALADAGARVVVNDIREPDAEELRQDPPNIFRYTANVTRKREVEEMFRWVKEEFGRLDILVNNVGIIRDRSILKMEEEDWDQVIETNLKSYFLCSQQAAFLMTEQKSGRIINISSRAWLGGYGQANYSASKGGIISLTRTLAIELAKHGITVNAIAPGLIDSPMYQSFRDDVKERLLKMQPMNRIGKPEDVAYAVLFFASDRASYITGQTLYVCGGKSLFSGIQ